MPFWTDLSLRFRDSSRTFRPAGIASAGRWVFGFILIGLIAGLGAIAFHWMCGMGVHYFMDAFAGYRPPAPAGEHHLLPPTHRPFNRWLLFLLPALGGMVSGWLVYTFAPRPKATAPIPPSTPTTTREGASGAGSPSSRPSPRPLPSPPAAPVGGKAPSRRSGPDSAASLPPT